jgi:N-acetylglucosaminyl-diphospho-decaprenol L-rhamnosyltransferase
MAYLNVSEQRQSGIMVSIVSHGQGPMVEDLLNDLARCPDVTAVVLTQNIPESEISCPTSLRSRMRIVRNERPKGFAANHNQAFQFCRAPIFAVVNPDVRFCDDPFPKLVSVLKNHGSGVIAPSVKSLNGQTEDSARYFPTPLRLLAKFVGRDDGRFKVRDDTPQSIDWAAGMFLLFPADVYREMGGFDENFFLYYEDVDICARLWRSGRSVLLHPGVAIIHNAQRTSRRQPRYMKWHFQSFFRYALKHLWRLPR